MLNVATLEVQTFLCSLFEVVDGRLAGFRWDLADFYLDCHLQLIQSSGVFSVNNTLDIALQIEVQRV